MRTKKHTTNTPNKKTYKLDESGGKWTHHIPKPTPTSTRTSRLPLASTAT